MTIAEGWLEQYLDEAIERQLCTKIGCTTCGAHEFRAGLMVRLGTPRDDLGRLDADHSLQLLEATRKLVAPRAPRSERVEAIRLVLFDCWAALGGDSALPQMKVRLGQSWAGQILDAMIAHHEERTRARREHQERSDPVMARQRRLLVKDERQRRHQERLEKKRQRDAVRRVARPENRATGNKTMNGPLIGASCGCGFNKGFHLIEYRDHAMAYREDGNDIELFDKKEIDQRNLKAIDDTFLSFQHEDRQGEPRGPVTCPRCKHTSLFFHYEGYMFLD